MSVGTAADRASTASAGQTPVRRRPPRRRAGSTTAFSVGGTELFVTANGRPDGTLCEVFAKFGKDGSTTAGLMDMVSILLSLALQHGVPLEVVVEKFRDMRFEPMGMTDDPEIGEAASVADYLARRLAADYLDFETRKRLNVLSEAEDAALPPDAYPAPTPLVPRTSRA